MILCYVEIERRILAGTRAAALATETRGAREWFDWLMRSPENWWAYYCGVKT